MHGKSAFQHAGSFVPAAFLPRGNCSKHCINVLRQYFLLGCYYNVKL